MTRERRCEQVRAEAFAYRRGELSPEAARAIDAHLLECDACGRYLDALGGMIETAATATAERWSTASPDEMFDGIWSRIEAGALDGKHDAVTEAKSTIPLAVLAADEEQRDERSPLQARDDVSPTDHSLEQGDSWTVRPPVARRMLPWMAAAAAIAIAFYVGRTTTAPADDTQAGGPATAHVVTSDEHVPADNRQDALEGVRPVATEVDGLRLFASDNAQWFVHDGPDGPALDLERGTALAEWIPHEGRRLSVRAGDLRGRVVGTIFYLDVEEQGEIGVIEGRVEVEGPRAAPRVIEAGQRVVGAGAVEPVEPATLDASRRWVDPVIHRRVVDAIDRDNEAGPAGQPRETGDGASAAEEGGGTVAPPTVGQPSGRPQLALREGRRERSAEPGGGGAGRTQAEAGAAASTTSGAPSNTGREGDPMPSRDGERAAVDLGALRSQAAAAQRARHWEEAADLYETLLTELPASGPEATAVRLDLVRIYLLRLERVSRAEGHLRALLARHPDDPAVRAARGELCRRAPGSSLCVAGQ